MEINQDKPKPDIIIEYNGRRIIIFHKNYYTLYLMIYQYIYTKKILPLRLCVVKFLNYLIKNYREPLGNVRLFLID